jgi:hypothetical protein
MGEKETARIVEKRMNFSAGQAIPYRFVFKTVFRQ